MKINWNQNPLRTTVDLDDRDKNMILLAIQNEEYSQILCHLNLWLSGEIDKDKPQTTEEIYKQVKKWGEICNMTVDHEDVQLVIEDLQYGHAGDCTCFAMSCAKCRAEEYLGINTIKGLGQHEGSKLISAFGKDGNRTIDEALAILKTPYDYETRHSSWEKYPREEYEKHIPRWEAERKNAIEWLEKYKEEHGF